MPTEPTTISVTARGETRTITSTRTDDEAIARLCELVEGGTVSSNFARSLVAQHRGTGSWATRRRPLSALQLRWAQVLVHERDQTHAAHEAQTVEEMVAVPRTDTWSRLEGVPSEDVADDPGGPIIRAFRHVITTGTGSTPPTLRVWWTEESNVDGQPDREFEARITLGRRAARTFTSGADVRPTLNAAGRMAEANGILAEPLEVRVSRNGSRSAMVHARITSAGHIEMHTRSTAGLANVLRELGSTQESFDAAITNIGTSFGRCMFCGHGLTDERSTSVGYGPVCASHWNLPWGDRTRAVISNEDQRNRVAGNAANTMGAMGGAAAEGVGDIAAAMDSFEVPTFTARRTHGWTGGRSGGTRADNDHTCSCCAEPVRVDPDTVALEPTVTRDPWGNVVCRDCTHEHEPLDA